MERKVTCTSCGNRSTTDEGLFFTCDFCGTTTVLAPVRGDESVESLLEILRAASASGNLDEVVAYANKVLERDIDNLEAWILKGEAVALQSNRQNLRFNETSTLFAKALSFVDNDEQEVMRDVLGRKLGLLCNILFKHFWDDYLHIKANWQGIGSLPRSPAQASDELLAAIEYLIPYWKEAHEYAPGNALILSDLLRATALPVTGVKGRTWKGSDLLQAQCEAIHAQYNPILQRLDPGYQPLSLRFVGSKEGCFVVTAASGDRLSPEVLLLQEFRDSVLSTTLPGRAFIRLYRLAGPQLAALIRPRPALRILVMRLVVRPIVALVSASQAD